MTKQRVMPFGLPADRPQNRATPRALFAEIERRYGRGGFTLDVCAEPWSAKCARYFTAEDDAFERDWTNSDGTPARVFCNPPFNAIEAWLRRALLEFQRGHCELIVFLVPDRRGASWFHEVVRRNGLKDEPIQGRVNYELEPGSPKGEGAGNYEDSMLIIFERPIVVAELRDRRNFDVALQSDNVGADEPGRHRPIVVGS